MSPDEDWQRPASAPDGWVPPPLADLLDPYAGDLDDPAWAAFHGLLDPPPDPFEDRL